MNEKGDKSMAELNYSMLIARVKSGDTCAYDEIVEALTHKMLRFAYSICRDERKAEEAVEDAFVDCFLHLSTLTNAGRKRRALLP